MMIPEMKQVNGIWRGKVSLSSWSAFFEEKLVIELNIGGDKIVNCIDSRYKVAYEYLIANQEKILDNILSALLKEYPIMQEEYGYDNDELDEYMPNVSKIHDFRGIMKPKRIYILDVEKDGMLYLGFHFDCTWDEEHNFGIMLYKDRVIKMGGADVAFLSWIAEEDKNVM